MPVFTTPTSLRARRATRSPTISVSSPINTSLASSITSDVSDTQELLATPTTPPLESETLVFKAKRAYDRDRQRAKKRKERADRERERATAPAPGDADCRHCRDGSGRSRGGAKPRLNLDVGADDKDTFTGNDIETDALRSPQVEVQEIIADVVEREAYARGEAFARGEPLQVTLGQLLKPGKARKSKTGEYELVPGMPVVIALDDHIAEDAELDEPWEHISADELDEKRVAPPSYATVLAKAL